MPRGAIFSTGVINAFFRLHSPTVIAKLRQAFPEMPDEPTPKEVFLRLRALRNKW